MDAFLTEKFGPPVKTQCFSYDTWKTPYGVWFIDVRSISWCFSYGPELPHRPKLPTRLGIVEAEEIKKIVEMFEKDKDLLRNVPPSVLRLQKETGGEFTLHPMCLGAWRISDETSWSAFNNPFSLSRVYSKGPDDFELNIWEEEDVRAEQTTDEVINTVLKKRSLDSHRKCFTRLLESKGLQYVQQDAKESIPWSTTSMTRSVPETGLTEAQLDSVADEVIADSKGKIFSDPPLALDLEDTWKGIFGANPTSPYALRVQYVKPYEETRQVVSQNPVIGTAVPIPYPWKK